MTLALLPMNRVASASMALFSSMLNIKIQIKNITNYKLSNQIQDRFTSAPVEAKQCGVRWIWGYCKQSKQHSIDIYCQIMEEDKTASVQEIIFITKDSVIKANHEAPKDKPKMVEEEGKNNQKRQRGDSKEQQGRVKSKGRKIVIGLIISLSALMFGYSIKEITSIPISQLAIHYSITMDLDVALTILIGILPLAAVLGAIITKVMMNRFRRLSGIYIFTIVNCVAVGLINVNMFPTLLVGRFLEGICIGFYSAIAPIYLREIAPKELRKLLGLFFSLGKVVGVLTVIIVQLILSAAKVQFTYRIVLSLTALFSILQAALIFFFGSDTPTEFIEKGKHHKARDVIKKLYKEKYVEEVMQEYIEESEAATENADFKSQNEEGTKKKKKNNKKAQELERRLEKKFGKSTVGMQEEKSSRMEAESSVQGDVESSMWESQFDVKQSSMLPSAKEESSVASSAKSEVKPKINFEEKRDKAYCLGFHLAAIRNLTGANAVITQGGIFIKTLNYGLGKYTSLIINSIQLLSVFIGLFVISSYMGKKPLFLMSLPLIALMNFALAIAMIYEQVLSLIIIMSLFMAIYGAGFLSPIWSYPSEIIPASQSLPSNILHWITLALCMLVPPLVSGFNKGNPFPVFIFFGIYGIIGFIHVRFALRESNGLTYKQIIQSFK